MKITDLKKILSVLESEGVDEILIKKARSLDLSRPRYVNCDLEDFSFSGDGRDNHKINVIISEKGQIATEKTQVIKVI
jgi:hypothetical protein